MTCCFTLVQGGAIVLILSRRINESLRINGCGIDGEIKVYVLAVSGKRVKLGIEAPDDIGVIRSELPSFTRNQSKGDVCDGKR
jgi:carbon storage regulator CsrA